MKKKRIFDDRGTVSTISTIFTISTISTTSNLSVSGHSIETSDIGKTSKDIMDIVPKTFDIGKTPMDIMDIVDIVDIILPGRWFFSVFQGPLKVCGQGVDGYGTENIGYN